MGEACSLSIHESQSRIWENNVARSLPFWEFFFEKVRKLYPDRLKGKTSLDFFKAVNKVSPSLIRIFADELTYHFHIMIRFEIERLLLNESIAVKALPEVWDARIRKYLGLHVPDASSGVLQDIHWSIGSIGYFPTYSLGSFYAAQFFQAARRALPDIDDQFRRGHFGGFLNWLKTEIYSTGKSFTSEELCVQVTGEPLNVSYFIEYMKKKLRVVYNIEI